MPEDFPQKITEETLVKFNIRNPGLYAINITARCNRKDDLRIEIDDQFFREIPPEKNIQKFNVPPAWNGTKLKGKSQTNIFLLHLEVGEHTISFIPKGNILIESCDFQQVLDPTKIEFNLEQQAESGNGRPWITIALIELPLKSIITEMHLDWHLFDGDDVKLIIDNEIEKNPSSILWGNWLWHATPQQIFKGSKKEQKTVTKNLSGGIHYLEFWADKTPSLHSVILVLDESGTEKPGVETDQPQSRIPTVDDPMWTEDFSDDTDQIILARAIFGEARNTLVPDEVRVAIGWVIKNRVASSGWPDTYFELITKPEHFSAFNPSDDNRLFVENPLHTGKEIDRQSWRNAYEIAGKVISGELVDLTQGANHYYDDSVNTPSWADEQQPTLSISYTNQYQQETKVFFLKL